MAGHDDLVVLARSSGLADRRFGLVSIGIALAIVSITFAVTPGNIIGFVDVEDVKGLIPR